MLGDINTKLENNGHVRIPKADAKPMPLPGESCQTNEAFTWKAWFGEHCNKYSAEAYQIFCKLEINYPVVPKPEILREGEETLQTYIKETVLPQLQQVNLETTKHYYNEMRAHIQQTEWAAQLRTHPTWPDIPSLPRKRKLPKTPE